MRYLESLSTYYLVIVVVPPSTPKSCQGGGGDHVAQAYCWCAADKYYLSVIVSYLHELVLKLLQFRLHSGHEVVRNLK